MFRCQSIVARSYRRRPRCLTDCISSLLHIYEALQEEEEECSTAQFAENPSTGRLRRHTEFFLVPQNLGRRPPLASKRRQVHTTTSWIPEVLHGYTIWGGAGFLLKTFHTNGSVPYWACFSIINILVRTILFPLTVYSAHTAARFRPVAPEIQFFLSMYQHDLRNVAKNMKTELSKVWNEGRESLRGIYKLHKVNPLAPFLSPLVQLPVFVYISTDLRKIVNGRDPELAQALTDCDDSALFWLRDLTEADPVFALPVLAGVAMYANVETALGRRCLAGEASSKANTGIMLKDIFQSVAVFMPCFSAHFPAGMQVYLCTTFAFTVFQNYALRNEHFRKIVGLPILLVQNEQPKIGLQLLDLKRLEQEADERRGAGPLLGRGVLYKGWRLSFPSMKRESSIKVNKIAPRAQIRENDPVFSIIQYCNYRGYQPQSYDPRVSFTPGVTASYEEMLERAKEVVAVKRIQDQWASMHDGKMVDRQLTEEQMTDLIEMANRGEQPELTNYTESDHVDGKRLFGKSRKKSGGRQKRKR